MKLVIVDNHTLVRKGLVQILIEENNVSEVLEASNINEGIIMISGNKPDIAIIDLKLGKEDGLEIPVKSKISSPNTKFIVLTSSMSHGDFLRGEDIGIDGYILKDASSEDIIYAIGLVNRGKKYYDPEIINYIRGKHNKSLMNKLTNREMDVFRELSKGLSNDEIAKKLFVSENTVKKHVSSILSKLSLKNRTQVLLLNNLHIMGEKMKQS